MPSFSSTVAYGGSSSAGHDTETRYAVIELELVAVVWALKKCKMYPLGLPHFQLVVDHKPLVSILNDCILDTIENPRIQRLKERTARYAFTTVWRKGQDHALPDALSCAPIDNPSVSDLDTESELSYCVCSYVMAKTCDLGASSDPFTDPVISDFCKAACGDNIYQLLISHVSTCFPADKMDVPPTLLDFWKIYDDLATEDGLVLYGS